MKKIVSLLVLLVLQNLATAQTPVLYKSIRNPKTRVTTY